MQWVIRSSGPRGLVGEAQLVASIEKPKLISETPGTTDFYDSVTIRFC